MASAERNQAREKGYAPGKPLDTAPVFVWPPRPRAVLTWLLGYPGYLWPWFTVYLVAALATWTWLTPELETMSTFRWNWVCYIFARNVLITIAVVGLWHFWLYMKRAQGIEFKYNPRWPAKDSKVFLFRSQNLDNIFWTFVSGVPVWTAWECVSYWLYANGYLRMVSFESAPIHFCLLLFILPLVREMHFYPTHRMIHAPFLYKYVHSLHHKNANPGPWSGLSMHPVEHVIYFSVVVLYWIVPSHPLLCLFVLQHAGLVPSQAHAGFERVKLGDGKSLMTHDYYHYLHHKYFECNYGADLFPADRWFGTFHDGTEAADADLMQRLKSRQAGA